MYVYTYQDFKFMYSMYHWTFADWLFYEGMEMNPEYKRNLYERGRDRLATLLGMVIRVTIMYVFIFLSGFSTYIQT